MKITKIVKVKVLMLTYSTEFIKSIGVCAAALEYESNCFGTTHSAKDL